MLDPPQGILRHVRVATISRPQETSRDGAATALLGLSGKPMVHYYYYCYCYYYYYYYDYYAYY